MNTLIKSIKTYIRSLMRHVARFLDATSNHKITPNGITIFGVLMHIPIALLIASHHFVWGAILLVIFGLFDTLDGELARLQDRSSVKGMLLDASTDRIKEAMLYTGIVYVFATGAHPALAAWAAAAVGASISVSYVKAKGEAAVASSGKEIPHHVLNRMFSDGLLTFEMRMFILVVGLLTDFLDLAVIIIALGASYTVLQRLSRISKRL